MEKNDEYFIKEAIKEARKAFDKDEVPVGAVIVIDGKIISRAHNLKELHQNGLYHAEMIAINKATKKLKRWILDDATIYVTLEPCLMCSGAILQSRIKRVCYGASEPKFGAMGSVVNVNDINGFNHKVEITCGIFESEISQMMKDFFKILRRK